MPNTFEYVAEGDWAAVQRLVDQLNSLNIIGKHLFIGAGAPTSTPTGRALYLRTNGGTTSTLYVWEGAAWVAK